jgi:hypothetical protein
MNDRDVGLFEVPARWVFEPGLRISYVIVTIPDRTGE